MNSATLSEVILSLNRIYKRNWWIHRFIRICRTFVSCSDSHPSLVRSPSGLWSAVNRLNRKRMRNALGFLSDCGLRHFLRYQADWIRLPRFLKISLKAFSVIPNRTPYPTALRGVSRLANSGRAKSRRRSCFRHVEGIAIRPWCELVEVFLKDCETADSLEAAQWPKTPINPTR